MMQMQPKSIGDCQKLPEATKDKEGFFPRVFRECVPIDTLILDFWPSEL